MQIRGFLLFVDGLPISLLCAKLFVTVCSDSDRKKLPYSCKQNQARSQKFAMGGGGGVGGLGASPPEAGGLGAEPHRSKILHFF